MLKRIVFFIYSKPLARALSFGFSNVIGAILVSIWLNDISSSGSPSIGSAKESLWSLVVFIYVIFLVAYVAGDYWFDARVAKWNDSEFIKAKLIDDIWPIYIRKIKEEIDQGKFTSLSEIVSQVKDIQNER